MNEEQTAVIQGRTYKIGRYGLPFVLCDNGGWRKTTKEVGEIHREIKALHQSRSSICAKKRP